jgi:hypothetical protein
VIDPDFELLALKRQLAWDMVQHADLADPESQRRFGLSPASMEVLKVEHRAAHVRLAHVLPFYERIKTLSALAATIAKPLILELLDEILDDTERDARFGALLTIASTAVLSDLLDKGLVTCNLEHY